MTSWFRFDLWECVGQAGGLVVYTRNLILIRRRPAEPAPAA